MHWHPEGGRVRKQWQSDATWPSKVKGWLCNSEPLVAQGVGIWCTNHAKHQGANEKGFYTELQAQHR